MGFGEDIARECARQTAVRVLRFLVVVFLVTAVVSSALSVTVYRALRDAKTGVAVKEVGRE